MIALNSHYKNKEEKLISDLKILEDSLNRINQGLLNEEIGYGCIVQVNSGKVLEFGRVTESKHGYFEVTTKEGKVLKNIKSDKLTNQSIGLFGQLEKQQWISKTELEEVKQILKNSELPAILFEKEYHHVQVIKIEWSLPKCQIITFIHSSDKISRKVKLYMYTINSPGFYQFRVKDKDIVEILETTKEVFEII